MPTKKTFILFTAVVATIALFTTARVAAQDCDPPYSCSVDGWTISLVGGAPQADTDQCPGSFLYTYKVTGPQNSKKNKKNSGNTGDCADSKCQNHINLAIPCCCPEEIVLTPTSSDPYHLYQCGEGEPTRGWLQNYFQARVLKFTHNDQLAEWSFCANTNTTTESTVCLKVANDLKCCAIEMPDCPSNRSEIGAFSSTGCLAVPQVPAGPVFVRFQRTDECAVDPDQVDFYFNCNPCEKDNCSSIGQLALVEQTGTAEYCSGTEGGRCPQCVSVWDFEGFACVEFAAVENIGGEAKSVRFQQCINDDGTPCESSLCDKLINPKDVE